MSVHDASTGNTRHDSEKTAILARQRKSRLFQIEWLDLRFSNGEERQFERLTGADRGAVMIIAMPIRSTYCLFVNMRLAALIMC